MNKWQSLFGFLALTSLALSPAALAQQRPYIGYTYPAGGQRGTSFQIRLGGQAIDDAESVLVSGGGVSARIVECLRRLNNQEVQLLREQIKELKSGKKSSEAGGATMMNDDQMMTSSSDGGKSDGAGATNLVQRLEKRVSDFVQTPACASIASLMLVEVTIAPDAEPGDREIRLVTRRGVSNPLVFQVGQLHEYTRKPMLTATLQVLGKEASALRKRPSEEVEDRVDLPCVLNGQTASGEVNQYRFNAHKGQQLVFATSARHLVPFIADAVPGWFQPVLTLYNSSGKEVAFSDDYLFKPDPVILYEVPADGEYVLVIRDSIYRGREDFVYRVEAGALPFLRSVFPMGGRQGEMAQLKATGWNLATTKLSAPADAEPGIRTVAGAGNKLVSNRLPFEVDTLPEVFEKENNNTCSHAQKMEFPCVINGHIDQKDDWDVFQFEGKVGQSIKAQVSARRLDSPLDSVIKLTDATGKLLAFSDDAADPAAGINTHPADSAFTATLPSDGTYFLHIGDTARQGGAQYAYRLRISEPQPDFALRVTPTSLALRSKTTAPVTVQLTRKDGFTGPVKLALKNPPEGFSASPVTFTGTQTVARITLKTTLDSTEKPENLVVIGTANIDGEQVTREAVPVEDRTQAFYWHHLVPATDFKVLVWNPYYEPPSPRPTPVIPTNTVVVAAADQGSKKQTFSKQQITGRLRQLKMLFDEGLLTDEFYALKVAECNAAQ